MGKNQFLINKVIKYDKQKSIWNTQGKLSEQKQEHAFTICGTKQRKNRPQTDIFQNDQPDTSGRRAKRILYKKRKKKK